MYYRHKLWKDHENFGNRNFTKTWNRNNFFFKRQYKSFESRIYFWFGRLTANNLYFNLGLGKLSDSFLIRYTKELWLFYIKKRWATQWPKEKGHNDL